MKNILRGTIAATALITFISGSQAADLMDAPISYWNGFYIGGQAGYFEANESQPGAPFDFDAGDGVALGGYAGYNMQLSNNLVVGLEGDYNFNLSDQFPLGNITEVDDFGSVRARVGYAMDATLLYVTGGVGFAGLDGAGGAPLPPGVDDVAVGFAVGGGIEHFFTQSISAKAEYIYMGFDDILDPVAPSFDLDIHTVRAGVAFHF